MPQVACNRQNPHLVVPHLIVRTPLPTGSSPATMTHIAELQNTIAERTLRIEALETWREGTVDPALTSLDERITDVEVGIAPVGSITMWPLPTPPSRWLLCDGTTYQSILYPDLAALIGDGGETFDVPDLRDYFVRGFNGVGNLLDTFNDTTRAPRNVATIPTATCTSTSHKHTHANTHNHGITVVAANAAHSHTMQDCASHNHGYAPSGAATSIDGTHQHWIGSSASTPISAYAAASLPTPLPYAGNESIYDNLDPYAGYNFFITTPNIYEADLETSSSPGHSHTIVAGGVHQHVVDSANANHNHAATAASSAPGDTDNASVTHQHTVDKTTGWDSETRPKGILMNFIIRY